MLCWPGRREVAKAVPSNLAGKKEKGKMYIYGLDKSCHFAINVIRLHKMQFGQRKAKVLCEPSLWSRLVPSVVFAAPRFSLSGLGLLFLGRKAYWCPSEEAVLHPPCSTPGVIPLLLLLLPLEQGWHWLPWLEAGGGQPTAAELGHR